MPQERYHNIRPGPVGRARAPGGHSEAVGRGLVARMMLQKGKYFR